MAIHHLEPQPDNPCFGCGAANPLGLRLSFELDDAARRVTARVRLPAAYQGSGGILHGGITALLFDEAMGKLNRLHDVRAVTAELSVAYLRPAACEEDLVLTATEISRDGRNLNYQAEMHDAAGRLLARAHARFVALAPRA
ncbi:MAG TPA: PaaI family thioesterase [Terriglobales bacterium]|jgi:uncharacterized protein (TIGR00369 family)